MTEKKKRRRRFCNAVEGGLTVASRHANRTTDL
jgi:hypothetical protein